MKISSLLTASAFLGLTIVSQAAAEAKAMEASSSSTDSPIQPWYMPYDLSIVNKVQLAGTDEASAVFQKKYLPSILKFTEQSLEEYAYKSDKDLAASAYDPSKLRLGVDSAARVYFISEGASYHNTLGFSTTGGSPLSKDAMLIFPDASASVGSVSSNTNERSWNEPLLPGDFVDLGKFAAGTQLDFFLIAAGAWGDKDFFSTNASLNVDGMVHAVSFALPDSPYLIIAFEDIMKGGDRDYNDLVFAIDLGAKNLASLPKLAAPEPSLAAGGLLAGISLLGFSRRRK